MHLFEKQESLYLPVITYKNIKVESSTPRLLTVFESIILESHEVLHRSDEYGKVPIIQYAREVLCIHAADQVIGPILEKLIKILEIFRLNESDTKIAEVTFADLVRTELGNTALKTGMLPSKIKEDYCEFQFDPITQNIIDIPQNRLAVDVDGVKVTFDENSIGDNFPQGLIEHSISKICKGWWKPSTQLLSVSRDNCEVKLLWRKIPITIFCNKDYELRISMKEESHYNYVIQELNENAEMFSELFPSLIAASENSNYPTINELIEKGKVNYFSIIPNSHGGNFIVKGMNYINHGEILNEVQMSEITDSAIICIFNEIADICQFYSDRVMIIKSKFNIDDKHTFDYCDQESIDYFVKMNLITLKQTKYFIFIVKEDIKKSKNAEFLMKMIDDLKHNIYEIMANQDETQQSKFRLCEPEFIDFIKDKSLKNKPNPDRAKNLETDIDTNA